MWMFDGYSLTKYRAKPHHIAQPFIKEIEILLFPSILFLLYETDVNHLSMSKHSKCKLALQMSLCDSAFERWAANTKKSNL